jgi:membrane protease YdiL (CAAX protease family)
MDEGTPIQSLVNNTEPDPLWLEDQRIFPVWSVWDIFLLFLFTGFAALIVGSAGNAIRGLLLARFSSFQLLHHPALEAVSLLVFQGLLDVLILFFIYFTITLKYNSPFWTSIKWTGKSQKHFLIYLPIGVLLALTVVGLSAVLPSPERPPIEELLEHPASAFLFAALGVFVAPFVEELIFRGFIYPVVERAIGSGLAVVITALLFTALHLGQLWGSWTGIVLILLVGITLSMVRATTDSLSPSFVIHLSYNFTLCLLFLITALVKGFPA